MLQSGNDIVIFQEKSKKLYRHWIRY